MESITSAVSPTDRVVWVSTATWESPSQSGIMPPALSSTRVMGAWPIVPRTS